MSKYLNINTVTGLQTSGIDSYYRNIAVSQRKYKNLPEGITSWYIEDVLFCDGMCAWLTTPKYGVIVLKCSPTGKFNIMGQPAEYLATGIGKSIRFAPDVSGVVMRNTPLGTPTSTLIERYNNRILKIERTLDINIMLHKIPWFIKCSDTQRVTIQNILKNLIKDSDNLEDDAYILADSSFNKDSIDVLKTEAPYIADKLTQLKQSVEGDIYTRLGIDNSQIEKKERLVTDEVNANNEIISLSYEMMNTERKNALEKINKMFGLNIELEEKEQPERQPQTEEKEVINNE